MHSYWEEQQGINILNSVSGKHCLKYFETGNMYNIYTVFDNNNTLRVLIHIVKHCRRTINANAFI